MVHFVLRTIALLACVGVVAAAPASLHAQSPEPKSAEPGKPETGGAAVGRTDEAAEPARAITGPAANSECVWIGERAVGLMWNDDLDTAFRHLDLYDRFGCPGGHIQITFRCVLRQGKIDQKQTEDRNNRVHACWNNPALPPTPAPTTAANEKPGTK